MKKDGKCSWSDLVQDIEDEVCTTADEEVCQTVNEIICGGSSLSSTNTFGSNSPSSSGGGINFASGTNQFGVGGTGSQDLVEETYQE